MPRALALSLVLAASAFACAPLRASKAWTVLLYMDATASDLVAPSARDLRSMEAPSAVPSWSAASTAEADVVVQLHRRAPPRVRRMRLIQVPSPLTDPDVQSPVVEALDEEGVPLEESLRRFVTWGIDRYPSERYAVIVWGHGQGFGGIAVGEGPRAVLDVPGLGRALASVSRRRLGGRPFDLYASDACLMQSIEVAGELVSVARYVVGSEAIEEDYAGLPYRAWLPVLNGSAPAPREAACPPADAACNAAAALVGRGVGVTLSALDEPALATVLLPSLGRLSAAIEGYLREDDLRRIGLRVLLGPDLGALGGTPDLGLGTRDLGLFLARLSAQVTREPGAGGTAGQSGVLRAVEEVRTALGRSVVAAVFGGRHAASDHEGMAGVSLWLPHDGEEYRLHGAAFAAALYRGGEGGASFRGFLDRVFAPPD